MEVGDQKHKFVREGGKNTRSRARIYGEYEAEKKKLWDLPPGEYEQEIRKLAEKLNI